jgi:hypothetical protein
MKLRGGLPSQLNSKKKEKECTAKLPAGKKQEGCQANQPMRKKE